MDKATQMKVRSRRSHAGLFLLGASLACATTVYAQYDTEISALQGQTCIAQRQAGSCTAKEFTVSVAADQGSNITSCMYNTPVTLDVVATVTSKQTDRYDIGIFFGENGQAPDAATNTQTCSVAAWPTNPLQGAPTWFDNGGNTCADYHGGTLTTTNLIHNVKVLCLPDINTGELSIPYDLSYSQGQSDTCTDATNIAPGAPSKCLGGGTPVAGVIVTYNADPGCSGKTVSYDPVAGTVTSTFTIVNNDPNNAMTADNADGTSFEDNLDLNAPPTVTVTSVTCTPSGGAAGCDTTATVGNDVKGTIATFPTGSSVLVTIVGTVPGGNVGTYSNQATVTPPADLTVGSDATGNNLCSNSTTLPVKLQSFDVN
jgi:hypothetical protein